MVKCLQKLLIFSESSTRSGKHSKFLMDAKKSVERKERSEIIIKKWKEKGLPELPENLSEISIMDRE